MADDWGRIDNRWLLIEPDGDRFEYRLGHRLYGAAELRHLLERAGFHNVEVYGGLDGSPFAPPESRLVVVGERP